MNFPAFNLVKIILGATKKKQEQTAEPSALLLSTSEILQLQTPAGHGISVFLAGTCGFFPKKRWAEVVLP